MTDIPDFLPPVLGKLSSDRLQEESGRRNELGQQEFFDLMIAQLRNQDPLEPLDSNDFLAQVAQFSTVNGIQEMQQSIEQLATSLQSSQALQASTLVGRDVLVSGERGVLPVDGALRGAVDVPGAVGDLVVGIFDPAGQLVRRLELGPQAAGTAQFAWDGLTDSGVRAPAGNYVVSAAAAVGGEEQALATLISSRVESVTLNRNPPGLTLNLDGLGPIDVNDIRQLL